ncbi:hypothetical protein V491_02698 [Pseudogymnoascus sp. VKM F-3775]|nr:hypothetical protein V491_02698 [Pseudogymnoascus sp. VKM F-3775]
MWSSLGAKVLVALSLLLPATASPTKFPRVENPSVPKHCALPAKGEAFQAALPAEVNLDPAAVNEAIAYATTHGRQSVQIFRHNCRVGEGPLDDLTDALPNNVWSVTKSVISMIVGVAYDRNLIALDDPIGKYLPDEPGWGDAAHRAIKIQDLLSEASGLDEAIFSEAITVGTDASAPQAALAQTLKYPPGTKFEYSQRVPDLVSYMIEQAVGEDIQTFAQKNIFDPIGIPSDSYMWLRDRSGNTYGYAFLFIAPTQLAKLGLLMQNGGSWNDQRLISSDWVSKVSEPSATNPCYGYFFWTNKGETCTGVNLPAAQTYNRQVVPSAPKDLFLMAGALQQNNFMIPSLGITVTWTGVFGDTEPNLAALLSTAPGADLYYNFFRILMRGVTDVQVPDAGPFQNDPLELDINPLNYLDPVVLLKDLISSPQCNIIWCNNQIPISGILENLEAMARLGVGLLGGILTGNAN